MTSVWFCERCLIKSTILERVLNRCFLGFVDGKWVETSTDRPNLPFEWSFKRKHVGTEAIYAIYTRLYNQVLDPMFDNHFISTYTILCEFVH